MVRALLLLVLLSCGSKLTGTLAESETTTETCASPPAATAPHLGSFNLSALSWAAPRVYLYPNFLSPEECEHLIDFAKADRKFDDAKDLNSIYFDWEAPRRDPIIADIETRVGIVTGVPPHRNEEPVNIHRIKQRKVGTEWTPLTERIHSVHHDKVQKEFSVATVIVYLNNVTLGGGTVWPCTALLPDGSSPRKACSEAFTWGARWFDGESTTVRGYPRKWTSPTEVQDQLGEVLLAADEACSTDGDFQGWANPALLTTATAGAAVVFFHEHPNGSPDPFAWHAGCAPLSNHKWTMQKFKEMPREFRRQ